MTTIWAMNRGRPRKLNRNSEAFLSLYLDPMNSPDCIRKACDISLATYYNYENELALPQLNVGIGLVTAKLPRKMALGELPAHEEYRELQILRALASVMQVRMKLIPILSTNVYAAPYEVRTGNVDFAMASISKKRKLVEKLYISNSYNGLTGGRPHGVLMRVKNRSSVVTSGSKPRLGVLNTTVHAEYAEDHLAGDFEILKFRTAPQSFTALRTGAVNFLLYHPSWLEKLPEYSQDIEMCSKPYFYKTHSGVIFSSDSVVWRDPLNSALAVLEEKRCGQLRSLK